MNAFNALKHIGFTGDGVDPYILPNPWIGDLSLVGSKDLGTSGDIYALFIKDDGSTMFAIVYMYDYFYMYKLTLSTPYYITSASVAGLTFSSEVYDTQVVYNIPFSSNGLYYYYTTSNMIFRNAFVNAWDNPHSNTLIQTYSGSLTSAIQTNYENDIETPPTGYYVSPTIKSFCFNAAGTSVFIAMKIQYVRDSPYNAYYETSIIQKYNLSSAWNIASTWTYAGCHNLNYISDSDGVTNMAISPDGAYVIVEDEDNNKKIFEFGTAWDVETLSLLTTKSASGVPQAYSSDGKYLYTVDSSDTIRQLVLQ